MHQQIVSAGVARNGLIVDDEGRAKTDSVSTSVLSHISNEHERSFLISNGVPLTSNSASAHTYIKNTSESMVMKFSTVIFCGKNQASWAVIRNPTAGTIVTDETAGVKGNLNFASSYEFPGIVYKGGEAKTFTDGTEIARYCSDSFGGFEVLMDGALVLGPGNSLGINCIPQPVDGGNFRWNALVYFEEV